MYLEINGLSAVGKTTLSKKLIEENNGTIVEEIHQEKEKVFKEAQSIISEKINLSSKAITLNSLIKEIF